MSYSQNNEEEIILKYFGDFVGTFCDIGANDGKTFSNTAALADRGWTGVCVEPSPGAYGRLCQHYAGNKNVTCYNVAISTTSGRAGFHDGADTLLSSFKKENTEVWKQTPFTEIEVETLTWENFFEIQPFESFDFINIDTEGMDYEILQQMDLSKVKLLCIEFGGHVSQIDAFCKSAGMKLLHKNGINAIYSR